MDSSGHLMAVLFSTTAYLLAFGYNSAPTTSIAGFALASDTGSSSTDFIAKTAEQSLTATLSAPLNAGEILNGSTDNGAKPGLISPAKLLVVAATWRCTPVGWSEPERQQHDKSQSDRCHGNDGPWQAAIPSTILHPPPPSATLRWLRTLAATVPTITKAAAQT